MTGDKYSFLTDEQWLKVCDVLADDLKRDRSRGVDLCAPSYPEAGQETKVCFALCTDGMTWRDMGDEIMLSDAIIGSNRGDWDEVRRVRLSLANTIAVLDAWLADRKA